MEKISLEAADAEIKQRMEAATKRRIEAGREFFVRACMAEGVDPEKGVSPSLLKILKGGMNAGGR